MNAPKHDLASLSSALNSTLLTRRQTLKSMAGLMALPSLAVLGCGGHGGGDGNSSKLRLDSKSTPTTLPNGFSLAPSALSGETAFGSGTLAKGAFAAKVRASGGPTLAWLREKATGKHVLFGFANGGTSGVSAKGSATAILSLAIGIGGLAPEAARELLALLEGSAATATLSAVLETRLAADPYALTSGDAQVQAAVQTAVASLAGGTPTLARSAPRADLAPLLSITPDVQSGSNVIQKTEASTIYPVNLVRRPAASYTYLKGYTNDSGDTALTTVQAFGDPQDLPPTTGLIASLASLGSNPAYAPVEGAALKLTLYQDSKKTQYDTIVLMASGKTDAESEPGFFSDPKYAAVVGTWRTKRQELNKHAWIGAVLFDIVASAIGGLSTWISYQAVLTAIAAIEAAGTAAAQSVIQAASGDFLGATFTTLEEAVGSGDIALSVQRALAQVVLEAEGASATAISGQALAAIGGIAALVVGTLAAAGTLLALADLGFSYKDLLQSDKGALWTDSLLKPSLGLNPSSTKVKPGARTTFTAATSGASVGNYRFHWKLSGGGNGTLSDDGGTAAGSTLDTTGPSVDLVTTPSDIDGAVYTVAVEAFDKTSGVSFGTAQATATIDSTATSTIIVPGTFVRYEKSGVTGHESSIGLTTVDALVGVAFTPPAGAKNFSPFLTAADGTTYNVYSQDETSFTTVFGDVLSNTARAIEYTEETSSADATETELARLKGFGDDFVAKYSLVQVYCYFY